MTTQKSTKRRNQIEFDLTLRPDGQYNFWQKRYVKGYSFGPDNYVWVLKGVYDGIPRWAHEQACQAA